MVGTTEHRAARLVEGVHADVVCAAGAEQAQTGRAHVGPSGVEEVLRLRGTPDREHTRDGAASSGPGALDRPRRRGQRSPKIHADLPRRDQPGSPTASSSEFRLRVAAAPRSDATPRPPHALVEAARLMNRRAALGVCALRTKRPSRRRPVLGERGPPSPRRDARRPRRPTTVTASPSDSGRLHAHGNVRRAELLRGPGVLRPPGPRRAAPGLVRQGLRPRAALPSGEPRGPVRDRATVPETPAATRPPRLRPAPAPRRRRVDHLELQRREWVVPAGDPGPEERHRGLVSSVLPATLRQKSPQPTIARSRRSTNAGMPPPSLRTCSKNPSRCSRSTWTRGDSWVSRER